MGACVECGKDVPEEQLEMTGNGHTCVDCRLAAQDAAGQGFSSLTLAAAGILVLSSCVSINTSTSTTVDGVTVTHTMMYGPLIGGPLALVLGAIAAGSALRQGRRDRNLAVGAVVAALGALQLVRALMVM